METQGQLSRRAFLGGSALAAIGASLGAGGLLAGCAPQKNGEAPAGEALSSTSSEGQSWQSAINPQDWDYTAHTTNFETIFSPWKLGSLEVRNRLVKSAAGSGYTQEGDDQALIEYYRNFARGGTGFVWVENFARITEHFEVNGVRFIDELPVREIAAAVHEEGAYVGYQYDTMDLLIGKHDTVDFENFTQAVATDLTKEDIRALQADIVAAVVKLQGEGIDAFEINAAGNNLGQAFLSRMRNERDDEYGPQSLENRARFVTELIEQIKQACGSDFVVQVLINVLEENDGALGQNAALTTLEENIEFAKLFESAGADSLHLRLGPLNMHVCQFASDLYFAGYGIDGTTGFGTQFDFKRHWQGKLDASHSGCGMTLDVAKEIKDAVGIPVGAVTYMDPAHAPDLFENAVKDGKVDFLLMNRPLTVDPEYANKLQSGKIDEIAPCTRCLHCHHDVDRQGEDHTVCRVNACTRRAYREEMPEGFALPEKTGDKKVMVVGGGPAGMEAARIAAQRGYEVTLYEKSSSLGGLLDFAHTVKGPHENLLALKDYLVRQLELAGVEVVTGKEVDGAFIEGQKPDVVVMAAGGVRKAPELAGAGATTVMGISDFLTQETGDDVVILGGNAQAVDAALYLLAQGKRVSIVLPDTLETLATGHSNWVKTFVLPMVYASGVRVWPQSSITSVEDGSVTIAGDIGVNVTVPCTAVIDARDMEPNPLAALSVDGAEVVAVGDCADPWNIANAIGTANIAARAL